MTSTQRMARVGDEDRTARARIRDAALMRFANDGFAGTSLKAIADEVGVSPALVIHHFGSKGGLRAACDEYVVEGHRQLIRDTANPSIDPMQLLREVDESLPITRYLARTLPEGSPQTAELIDDLLENALASYPEMVKSGVIKPADDPRKRAVILLVWNLGMLVLHEQVERLLGVDLTRGGTDGWLRVGLPMVEILANGVFQQEFYERWREATEAALRESQAEKET